MLTSWYVRSELPFRIAILYAGNTLSNCFGGLIAAGVLGGMEGVMGLRACKFGKNLLPSILNIPDSPLTDD